MTNQQLILIIEDEDGISNFISAILSSNNFACVTAKTAADGLSLAMSNLPDLILLDLGLPDKDGLLLLKEIRKFSTKIPVVIISARLNERDKVAGLDGGADDYISKPFGTNELIARVKAALRRAGKNSNGEILNAFKIRDFDVNFEKRIVTVDGVTIHLTPIEYKIIVLLCHNVGKVLTHDFIISQIWGPFSNDNQALRVNMANIRRKIEKNSADPKYILTEVGVGYRLSDDELTQGK